MTQFSMTYKADGGRIFTPLAFQSSMGNRIDMTYGEHTVSATLVDAKPQDDGSVVLTLESEDEGLANLLRGSGATLS